MTKCSFLKPKSIAVKASKKVDICYHYASDFMLNLKMKKMAHKNISFMLWVNTTKKIDFLD